VKRIWLSARAQTGLPARKIDANVRGVMLADDVLSVLAVLRNAGADVWIGGGWGIDALVGRQTRPHRDLDLMHRENQEPAVVAALADKGFAETLDWRPVRFAVTDPAAGKSIFTR
jgi:lincosamide nucleotidyltransferase A/C/D/E